MAPVARIMIVKHRRATHFGAALLYVPKRIRG
jgi:hypothetical protein